MTQGNKAIVMQPSIPSGPNGKRRELAQDDKDGAKAIYNYIGWAGQRITSNSGWSVDPAIAVTRDKYETDTIAEENYVHLVWSDDSTGHYKIYYKQHVLGGNENVAWTPTIGLNSPSGDSDGPDIAAVIGIDFTFYVHVVWQDNSPGNNEIYYARSVNGGATFSSPVRLTQNQGDSIAPAIAADEYGGVYIVWTDNDPGIAISNPANYEIFFIRSTDFGASWRDKERLTNTSDLPGYTAFSGSPEIALGSGGDRYVVWRDNRNYLPEGGVPEIYFKKFIGSVWAWGSDKRLTTSSGGGCYQPAIAVSEKDNAIHIVYLYEVPENFNGDIFYLKSTNNGDSFPYTSRICTTYLYSDHPRISLGYVREQALEYILHVVWTERISQGGEEEIYYARSKGWGSGWSAPARISYNETNCYNVSVSAFGYNIHIAWSQKVGAESDYEIHHRRNRTRVE